MHLLMNNACNKTLSVEQKYMNIFQLMKIDKNMGTGQEDIHPYTIQINSNRVQNHHMTI